MDTSIGVSKFTLEQHDASKKILWSGDYLDGKLTIVYCACCNEDNPSDIPGTVLVDFTLIDIDGTTFVGVAAVTLNKEGVDELLKVINTAYGQYLVDYRSQYQCQLH